MEEIHVGDIGTSFELTVHEATTVLDISAASAMEITFLRGDGSTLTVPASFLTDGTDGIIHYVTIASDLNVSGPWEIQGKVTLPLGQWSTDIKRFRVYDNLV